VRSVHANLCVVVNSHGTEYQLPPLGACTDPGAQWRIWRDPSLGFQLESLYYPGECLAYAASTLAPCSSDYVKTGWWLLWAAGQHSQLESYGSVGNCASVQSPAELGWDSCQSSPTPDVQLWDLH
jgi:hypothetical protein